MEVEQQSPFLWKSIPKGVFWKKDIEKLLVSSKNRYGEAGLAQQEKLGLWDQSQLLCKLH